MTSEEIVMTDEPKAPAEHGAQPHEVKPRLYEVEVKWLVRGTYDEADRFIASVADGVYDDYSPVKSSCHDTITEISLADAEERYGYDPLDDEDNEEDEDASPGDAV